MKNLDQRPAATVCLDDAKNQSVLRLRLLTFSSFEFLHQSLVSLSVLCLNGDRRMWKVCVIEAPAHNTVASSSGANNDPSSQESFSLIQFALRILLLSVFALSTSAVKASDEQAQGGSLCFLVNKGDKDAFTLKSTTVQANVIGVIADVHVHQVYFNRGTTVVEGTYIFPASTRAAVYGMTMKVRDRITKAIIKEKHSARQIYNTAVSNGQAASLLEQIKDNIFQMTIGNVLPQDSIVIDLHYTEAIEYANGLYEFVYPAIVGPRYVSSISQSEYAAALAGKSLDKEIPGEFHIECNLSTGVPVKSVLSPSHTLEVKTVDARSMNEVEVGTANSITSIRPDEKSTHVGNRDFVIRYRLSGRALESGLLLSKSGDENFFMLMVQPPKNVQLPIIVPREYVFIVDVSGSMWGKPLEIATQLMSDLLDKLRPEDRFNILMFSGGQLALSDNSLPITDETRQRAKNFLKSGYGNGGTELLPALKRAFAMNTDAGYSRNFVAITDGFVQCEQEAFQLVRRSLNKANFYAFGIGGSVNRLLIEGLARAGNAEAMVVTNMSESAEMAKRFREYIEAPVLTNISIDYGNLKAYEVDPVSIGDVTSQRPIIVYGKWNGDATGVLHLRGSAATGMYDFSVDVSAQPIRPENSALRYLWARKRIRTIQDGAINGWGYAQALSSTEQTRITELGLKYNLLTDYTSFVAVDSVVSVTKQLVRAQTEGVLRPDTTTVVKDSTKNVRSVLEWQLSSPGVLGTSGIKRSPSTTGSAASQANQQSKTKQATILRGSDTSVEKVLVDGQDVSDQLTGGIGSVSTTRDEANPSPTKAKHLNSANSSKPTVKNQAREGRAETDQSGSTAQSQKKRADNTLQPAVKNKSADAETSKTNNTRITDAKVSNDLQLGNQGVTGQSAKVGEETVTSGSNNASTTANVVLQNSQDDGSSNTTLNANQSNSGSTKTKLKESVTGGASSVASEASNTDNESNPLNPTKAAPQWYVGLILGSNISMLETSYGSIKNIRSFEIAHPNGSAKSNGGYFFGGTVKYVLGDARNSARSLQLNILYDHQATVYEADAPVMAYRIGSFDTARTTSHFKDERRYDFIHAAIQYRFSVMKSPLFIVLGPSISFSLTSKSKHNATLDSGFVWSKPGDVPAFSSDTDGRRLILHNGTDNSVNKLRIGLSVGIQYELLFRHFELTPQLTYDYSLTSVLPGSHGLHAIKLGIALTFGL